MAVHEYKQMTFYYGEQEAVSIEDALLKYAKGKGSEAVYATFVLKRRQIIETWITQITKALYATYGKVAKAIKTYDSDCATADDFIARHCTFEYDTLASDVIKVTICRKAV